MKKEPADLVTMKLAQELVAGAIGEEKGAEFMVVGHLSKSTPEMASILDWMQEDYKRILLAFIDKMNVAIRLFILKPKPYQLGNAETMRAAYPGSFQIPERAERASLLPGNVVKLLLQSKPKARIKIRERLWAQVVMRDPKSGLFLALLLNDTVGGFAKKGDLVAFGPENVLDIELRTETTKRKKKGAAHAR